MVMYLEVLVYLNLCVYIFKIEVLLICLKVRSLVGLGYFCRIRWVILRL